MAKRSVSKAKRDSVGATVAVRGGWREMEELNRKLRNARSYIPSFYVRRRCPSVTFDVDLTGRPAV